MDTIKKKILIELAEETKRWLETRAEANGRPTMREAEKIIENCRKRSN